jgi:arginase family enzyme
LDLPQHFGVAPRVRPRPVLLGEQDISLGLGLDDGNVGASPAPRRFAPRDLVKVEQFKRRLRAGGDHSIGFPTMRGIAQCTSRRIGIIHFDRHADIQEKDLDERMHTTPWFHATNLPNVPAGNLVQIGIGGWQVPREA